MSIQVLVGGCLGTNSSFRRSDICCHQIKKVVEGHVRENKASDEKKD